MAYPAFLATPDNAVAAAAVSASSQTVPYPATNAQALKISNPWRTTGVAAEYIEFDLGSAQAISLIALINHNLTAGATITVKAGAAPNPSTFTQVMTWRKYDAFLITATQTYRYWRITFADAGNTAGFLSVGYAMIGALTQMVAGFAYDWPFSDAHTNLQVKSEFNVRHVAPLAYQVRLQHVFNQLDDSTMNVLRALFNEVHQNVYPFLWIPDSAVNDAYFMTFASDFTRTMGFYRSATIDLIEESRGKVIAA